MDNYVCQDRSTQLRAGVYKCSIGPEGSETTRIMVVYALNGEGVTPYRSYIQSTTYLVAISDTVAVRQCSHRRSGFRFAESHPHPAAARPFFPIGGKLGTWIRGAFPTMCGVRSTPWSSSSHVASLCTGAFHPAPLTIPPARTLGEVSLTFHSFVCTLSIMPQRYLCSTFHPL